MALEVVHFVSERRKFFLQGNPGIARQLAIVFRPGCLDQPAAMHAVSQMTNRNRVSIGVVVLLQHPEIFRDYKSGAIGAAREEEDAFAGGGKGLAVSATHAERLPLRECRPAAHVVEA